MFSFQFLLDDRDFFEFNKYHLFLSPATKKIMTLRRWIPPCFATALWLLVAFKSDPELRTEAFIGAVTLSFLFMFFWLILFKPLYIFSLKTRIKKTKKTGKLSYSQENELIFDEEFILDKDPDTETKTKYRVVERIVITNEMFYIYLSTTRAILLPLSAFQSTWEQSEFLAFLESKTPTAAIVRHKM